MDMVPPQSGPDAPRVFDLSNEDWERVFWADEDHGEPGSRTCIQVDPAVFEPDFWLRAE
jgi:hypothetical protein